MAGRITGGEELRDLNLSKSDTPARFRWPSPLRCLWLMGLSVGVFAASSFWLGFPRHADWLFVSVVIGGCAILGESGWPRWTREPEQ
jgi:hypothetical protein